MTDRIRPTTRLPRASRHAAPVLLAALVLGCQPQDATPPTDTTPPPAAPAGALESPPAMPADAPPSTADADAAADPVATGLQADDAWIRLLPGELPAGGYVVLRNDGDAPRRLVGADSADYGRIMLHQSMDAGGMSRMRAVDGIEVPAHGRVALQPGGYHLMLMAPKASPEPGQSLTLRLRFDDGSHLDVPFAVRPANATD